MPGWKEFDRYSSIIDAVYEVKDPEKLELIERFVRRLTGQKEEEYERKD